MTVVSMNAMFVAKDLPVQIDVLNERFSRQRSKKKVPIRTEFVVPLSSPFIDGSEEIRHDFSGHFLCHSSAER